MYLMFVVLCASLNGLAAGMWECNPNETRKWVCGMLLSTMLLASMDIYSFPWFVLRASRHWFMLQAGLLSSLISAISHLGTIGDLLTIYLQIHLRWKEVIKDYLTFLSQTLLKLFILTCISVTRQTC